MGLLGRIGRHLSIRRRTMSSAWTLVAAGDLRGVVRRTARRLAQLRPDPRINHSEWRQRYVDLTDDDRKWILAHPSDTPFSVTIKQGKGAEATAASLKRQLHAGWTVEPCAGRWTIELEAGVVLHEAALWSLAKTIDDTAPDEPGLRLVYADHDHLDVRGKYDEPAFLPDWNPELFAGLGRISSLLARHPDVNPDQIWTLEAATVIHLPHLLASRPVENRSTTPPVPALHPSRPAAPPRVSVLIPTKDQGRLLETCLKSIRSRSTHPDVELVLVDHETTEPHARRVLDALTHDSAATVLQHQGSFNFATMMNQAAAAASGEQLVLLNNDTEVVSPDWLESMTAHLDQPGVGVVGALLLFSDGTIQHAGVHPGLGGLMGHGHKHLPGTDPGHLERLRTAHRVAAVTGACLAIKADLWHELGGLDEGLAVAYNDIDLCMKARSADLTVLLEPRAVLHHHESVSRGYDDDPGRRARLQSEVDRMRDRWGDRLDEDPAYSPNLSLTEPGFAPADPPRVRRPWRHWTVSNGSTEHR